MVLAAAASGLDRMLLVSERRGVRPDAGFPSRVSTVVTRAASYHAYPPYSYPPHVVLLQWAEEMATAKLVLDAERLARVSP